VHLARGVDLDRLGLAGGFGIGLVRFGLAAVLPIVAVALLGNAARITRQDPLAPTTRPRAACLPAHASTTATSRVLTSVIISSETTSVVVAASAAPTLPMKADVIPPSHSPSRPPGPCDVTPPSANGRKQEDRDRGEQHERAGRLARALEDPPPAEAADRGDQHARDDQVRREPRRPRTARRRSLRRPGPSCGRRPRAVKSATGQRTTRRPAGGSR
jgi:hypothetical protein